MLLLELSAVQMQSVVVSSADAICWRGSSIYEGSMGCVIGDAL